jgi:hypothetical protein
MRFLSVLFVLAVAACVRGAELQFNLSDVPDGSLPTNFVSLLGGTGMVPKWQVIDAEVPSQFTGFSTNAALVTHGKVLAQTSDDMTDEHFPMCVYQGDIYRDFKFSTQFKIINGISEQMAGIVFRFQNVSNYYYTRFSAAGKNLRFFKVVNGVRSDPIGVNLDLPVGEWHSLAVQCDGNHITIFLDGHPAMPMLGDNSFTEGRVGFWTKSDSVTYFSHAEISYTPRIPPAKAVLDAILAKQVKLLGLRLYAVDATGTNTYVIASKDQTEVGQPGTDDVIGSIHDNKPYYGREHGAVDVTMPLRDRNGEIIGAMRVKMKHFFGETEDSAVTQAFDIRRSIEDLCPSANDLGI